MHVYTDIEGLKSITANKLYEVLDGNDRLTGVHIRDDFGRTLFVLTELSSCRCSHLKDKGQWKFHNQPSSLENE